MTRATRYTFTTLRAGQPRAYADTEYVTQMFIEVNTGAGWFPLGTNVPDLAQTPEGWPEINLEAFKEHARAQSGWSDDPGIFGSRLDYFRQVGPGLIEWRVVMRYDD